MSNQKPTEIYDVPDVYHFKPDIQLKYLDAQKEGGKWMMFIEKSKLDKKWEEVCKMYDKGVLDGIYQVKCSTSYKNPRASTYEVGCIRFCCGPASDQKKIMAYGANILKWIKYEDKDRYFMFYKTDKQSETGTSALGQKRNHTYRIPIPGAVFDDYYEKMRHLDIIPARKPTEINDEVWTYHYKSEITSLYSDAYKEMGKWMMFIKKSELDKKWEEVCKFYDEGVLDGICQLKCSTNYKSPATKNDSIGVIILYCGPASDEKKIMEYGANILKLIEYKGHDFMYYKTDEQTRAGVSGINAPGHKKKHTYCIAVPKAAPSWT